MVLPSLTLYMARFFGMRMLGWVRMNSPRALSYWVENSATFIDRQRTLLLTSVKPLTEPPLTVRTNCAEAPYLVPKLAAIPGLQLQGLAHIVKPAATISVPGSRISPALTFLSP